MSLYLAELVSQSVRTTHEDSFLDPTSFTRTTPGELELQCSNLINKKYKLLLMKKKSVTIAFIK